MCIGIDHQTWGGKHDIVLTTLIIISHPLITILQPLLTNINQYPLVI